MIDLAVYIIGLVAAPFFFVILILVSALYHTAALISWTIFKAKRLYQTIVERRKP